MHDAKVDIIEKCHLPERLEDHGLFLAPSGGKKGMWMLVSTFIIILR